MKILQLLSGGNIAVYPDSALISGGRPVFLPTSGAPWIGKMFVGYRVSRLGKNISVKFAHRYIDAFSAIVVAYPAADSILTTEWARCVDGAVAIGKWLDVTAEGPEFTFNEQILRVTHNDTGIYEAVSEISKLSTLKNGDIIIPSSNPLAEFPLVLDSSVKFNTEEETILAYNIK